MAVVTAVAEVFGVSAEVVFIKQALESLQKGFVQRGRTADRERQAVGAKRVALGEMPELLAELAADADPVFRCDLEKIDTVPGGLSRSGPIRVRRRPSPVPLTG